MAKLLQLLWPLTKYSRMPKLDKIGFTLATFFKTKKPFHGHPSRCKLTYAHVGTYTPQRLSVHSIHLHDEKRFLSIFMKTNCSICTHRKFTRSFIDKKIKKKSASFGILFWIPLWINIRSRKTMAKAAPRWCIFIVLHWLHEILHKKDILLLICNYKHIILLVKEKAKRLSLHWTGIKQDTKVESMKTRIIVIAIFGFRIYPEFNILGTQQMPNNL